MNQKDFEKHIMGNEHKKRMNDSHSLEGSQTSLCSTITKSLSMLEITQSESPQNDITKIMIKSLDDLVKVDGIFDLIETEAIDLLVRTDTRIAMEKEIIKILTKYIKSFDNKLNVIPFGSTTYGFGGSHTNLNIWIDTCMFTFSYIHSFFKNKYFYFIFVLTYLYICSNGRNIVRYSFA